LEYSFKSHNVLITFRNELREWQPIVDELRVAEQIHFPQDEFLDNPLKVQSAEERAKTFTVL